MRNFLINFSKVPVCFKFFSNTIDKLDKLAKIKGINKTKVVESLIYREYDKLF